jgi:hypothetical protein
MQLAQIEIVGLAFYHLKRKVFGLGWRKLVCFISVHLATKRKNHLPMELPRLQSLKEHRPSLVSPGVKSQLEIYSVLLTTFIWKRGAAVEYLIVVSKDEGSSLRGAAFEIFQLCRSFFCLCQDSIGGLLLNKPRVKLVQTGSSPPHTHIYIAGGHIYIAGGVIRPDEFYFSL